MATASPGSTPMPIRPRAASSTCLTSSLAVMGRAEPTAVRCSTTTWSGWASARASSIVESESPGRTVNAGGTV